MAVFTNYLQLRDRLTQVWVNKYTLLLILAVFKLFFFSRSIVKEFNTLRQFILNNCSSIDLLYDKIAYNTPHYVGKMGNFMIEKSMEEAIKATLEVLSLIVLASEELITFIIDLYLGTYACLLVSAVDGTVEIATNTTEKLLSAVNNTVSSFANDLDDGLDDISKVINKILSAASEVENFFTDDDDEDATDSSNKISKVNLTIDALRNFHIPSSINEKLEEISANTPNFDTLKNDTKNLIAEPFKYVRDKIKNVNTTDLITDSTDMLYVPPLKIVSDNETGICSSNKPTINNIFDDLNKSIGEITKILIIVLLVVALLAILWECWQEYKQWILLRNLRNNYQNNFDFWYNDCKHDAFDEASNSYDDNSLSIEKETSWPAEKKFDILSTYQQTFHRWQTLFANTLTRVFTINCKDKLRAEKIQWFVAYITSERVLFMLGIGLLGILISCFQLIVLAVLKKELQNVKALEHDISNSHAMKTFKQDMQLWSIEGNNYINNTESNINTEIFGWVETTTTSINDTVNTMITGIDHTLADIFNGTLLYHPMQTVVKCVIEDKLYAVEKAMTWIHEKAHLSIPRINDTQIVQLIANNSTNSTNSVTLENDNKSAMHQVITNIFQEMHLMLLKIVKTYHDSIMAELLISTCIIALWAVQIPVGILLIYIKSYTSSS